MTGTRARPAGADPLAAPGGVDAYRPEEMARLVRDGGPVKAHLDVPTTVVLGVLAGAFVGLGAAASTAVMTGGTAGYGAVRLAGGVVFATGLVLVLVGGAQLSTSNSLLVMAWVSRLVTLRRLLLNWALVWVGNLVGAVATAVLVLHAGQPALADGAVSASALVTAAGKLERDVGQAVLAGVLGNGLVCLAVWLSHSARSTTDRVVAVVGPVVALVLLGVDHAVGTMYHLTAGLLVRDRPEVLAAAGLPPDALAPVHLASAVGNLLAVTAGNVVGGGVLVGAVYWFVYLRGRPA